MLRFIFLGVAFITFLLQGCESRSEIHNKYSFQDIDSISYFHSITQQLWLRVSYNFKLKNHSKRERVKYYARRYENHTFQLCRICNLAEPYLYHIIEALEHRNMPSELALLPIVESSFKPYAISNRGACGLWQLSVTTARRFGLKQNFWYDERKDVAASTAAALEYLALLFQEFNQDWLLTLAAYNAGEGRIKRAIRYNCKRGKLIDFWSIKLTKQTQHFVPKLLALANVINIPNGYGALLSRIENKPYFAEVYTGAQIDLHLAADLACIDTNLLKLLNPGYIRSVTHPNSSSLLLLTMEHIAMFYKNINRVTYESGKYFVPHIIQVGETLNVLKKQYQATIIDLMQFNQISIDTIISSRKLLIPVQALNYVNVIRVSTLMSYYKLINM